MNIPFNHIQDTRVPLFYAEVDNSKANTAREVQRALIIGQMTADGEGVKDVPVISQGTSDAKKVGGEGSMLALMTEWYRKRDTFGELWYLPLEDAAAGLAASGTITYAGVPTETGVISLYVAGEVVNLAVTTADTASTMAAGITALINADTDLPVTAAAAEGVVTVTAKNKGLCGNDIDLRHNYYGAANGESLPSGITATIVAMNGGATNPALTTALANLSDMQFDFIVLPYTDATSLNEMKSFMNDSAGRWSWNRMIYGHAFSTYQGTFGELTTFGAGRNDPHVSVMGIKGSPTPSWLAAANLTAVSATSLRIDPARPLQTLETDILAPSVEDRWAFDEANTLLNTGISTYQVANDGTVSIQRMVTTYQKNSFGQADNSYLSIETMFTLMYVLRFLRSRITSRFSRMKLAANGTRIQPGSSIVTPNTIKADQIAAYSELEALGLVQKADAFKDNIIVEKSSTDPNRVDVLWPGTLINQLNVFALLAQFRLI